MSSEKAANDLFKWGFDSYFKELSQRNAEKDLIPARVIGHSRDFYDVVSEKGAITAKMSGSIRFHSLLKSELPAVGDWVMISLRHDKAYIASVLPRKSCFSRRCSGDVIDEQVVAANIDIVFIAMSLDGNYNLNRLQRYISVASSSGVKSVILLTKSDLCSSIGEKMEAVRGIAPEKEILTLSSTDPKTADILSSFIRPGTTAVFVGSSGVGKSTLINILAGEERQTTGAISTAVNKGRHTTSARELILLPSGGIVIDTPGMREIQNWQEEDSGGFEMITELSANCRFADCRHMSEPGCAVKEAVETGILPAKVLEMWQKQLTESEELKIKKERSLKILETRKTKRKLGR